MPNSENSGYVSFISQVRPNSITMRKMKASDKPDLARALAPASASSATPGSR